MTGHLLGAAGAVEAFFAPCHPGRQGAATINLDNLDPDCAGLDIVKTSPGLPISAMSCPFLRFGGTNAPGVQAL